MAKRHRPSPTQPTLFEKGTVLFGPGFLRDHAGQIMADPRVAVVELVANCYDAGARNILIEWPGQVGGVFSIRDDGTGMTPQEFEQRWRTLSYRRVSNQGSTVQFPIDAPAHARRVAFGQNGKGRHGAFCFADSYVIETKKDGRATHVKVSLADDGTEPWSFGSPRVTARTGHGTVIRAKVARNRLTVDDLRRVLGSKFLVDPDLSISINGRSVDLLKLDGVIEKPCTVEGHGTVTILHIDPERHDRTTDLRGITWWVNNRMVGLPSWDGLDERDSILDGRTAEAKRFSFVVKADFLHDDVDADWSGFKTTERVAQVRAAVRLHISRALEAVLATGRRDRKRQALAQAREALIPLSNSSKKALGDFVGSLASDCPRIKQDDLAKATILFANLEKSRTGYELLAELASCSPDDLDRWTTIMHRWSARDAETVLNELHWRLDVIQRLEFLVDRKSSDELHDLQPLFERGLWIFGPEYEAIEFRSNRRLASTLRELLGGVDEPVPPCRPDFVAVPDGTSIGLYSADAFDDGGDVVGIRKVLVVELKRGGSKLTQKDVAQPEQYVAQLRKGNSVGRTTLFSVYVLGSQLDEDASDERAIGDHLVIVPLQYGTLMKRAHARTFHLLAKLREMFPEVEPDPDVQAALAQGALQFSGLDRNGSHRTLVTSE